MSAPELPASSTPGEQGVPQPSSTNEASAGEQSIVQSTASESATEAQDNAPSSAGGDLQKEPVMAEENRESSQAPAEGPPNPAPDATATPTKEEPPNSDRIQEGSISDNLKALSINTDTEKPPSSSSDVPPPPPEKDESHTEPGSKPPSSANLTSENTDKNLPKVPTSGNPDEENGAHNGEGDEDDGSRSEIQSIMEQFTASAKSNGHSEIMSPRLELAEQFLGPNKFPPRKSSLEHMNTISSNPATDAPSPSAETQKTAPQKASYRGSAEEGSLLNRRTSTSTVPPPPAPEPDQPFDFHRFLEQLRHRTADPVARFLRSFLMEFGKRQWMVHEQVKIISDFLVFITNKMAMCEIWRNVSDSEFDNAKEGMEKLVMNRLYSQTFSPVIPSPPAIPRTASRSKRRELERRHGPWRRGQHQEDIERDDVLAQKMGIYSWVREEHLDIPPMNAHGRRFLSLAQQELSKMNSYRAPRDKVICILNCCKVIFGLLKNTKQADTSADSFIPLLIFVVLKANPNHLVSNIQYILRFRNQEKLGGEAGYYLSSLSGAVQFIETLDRTSLTVSDEEFERNVEATVSAIAEQNRKAESYQLKLESRAAPGSSQSTARTSAESQRQARGREAPQSSSDEENAPVAGLLRTIQKPLTTIGRIFSDEPDSSPERTNQTSGASPRLSPNVYQPPRSSGENRRSGERSNLDRAFDAQDASARQASAEEAEARKIHRVEHNNLVETLSNMFPNLDRDVIDDVVKMKEGRVGLAVDACLALSAE